MLTMRDGRSASATDNTYLTTYAYDAQGQPDRGHRTVGPQRQSRRTTTARRLPARVDLARRGRRRPSSTTPAGDVVTSPASTGWARRSPTPMTAWAGSLTETETTSSFPAGLTTSYTYDKLGRVLTQTEPAVTNRVTGAVHTAVTTSVYNADGSVTSQTVADTTGGDAARVDLDHLQRLRPGGDRDRPEGRRHPVRVRRLRQHGQGDRAGRRRGRQRLRRRGQPAHQQRSSAGRATPTHRVAAKDLVTETKSYDPAGRLASETDAMGWSTRYTYTDNGLEAKVVSDRRHQLVRGGGEHLRRRRQRHQGGHQQRGDHDDVHLRRGRAAADVHIGPGWAQADNDLHLLARRRRAHQHRDRRRGRRDRVHREPARRRGQPARRDRLHRQRAQPGGPVEAGRRQGHLRQLATCKPTGNVTWVTSPRVAAAFDGTASTSEHRRTGPRHRAAPSPSRRGPTRPKAARTGPWCRRRARTRAASTSSTTSAAGGKWSFVMYNSDDQRQPPTTTPRRPRSRRSTPGPT